jgi:putative membrane protein
MSYIDTKKKWNRIVACVMAVILSASMTISPLAAEAVPNTPKEEVVYVNLNTDGSVKEINVVNIFDLDKDGQIVDYGRYESLRNMTTTDKIEYSGDKVTVDAKAGKLYYEGKLSKNVMPWDLSLHYYLDGKEYPAEEIAGKSGALKITMSIRKNPNCSGAFFENYALQASVTLDTNQCENIVTEDATVANVGSKKQLTYTILPGKEADLAITADVKDFEMPAIAVNGVPLSLDIEVDDEELMSKVDELVDGIVKLDDGSLELKDGASELKNGSSDLESGALDLRDGMSDLDGGVQELYDGILKVQDGLLELDSNSDDLTEGSAKVKEALKTIQEALKSISASSDQIDELVKASNEINDGIGELVGGISTLKSGIDQYKAGLGEDGLKKLQQGNGTAIELIDGIIDALNNVINMLSQIPVPLEQEVQPPVAQDVPAETTPLPDVSEEHTEEETQQPSEGESTDASQDMTSQEENSQEDSSNTSQNDEDAGAFDELQTEEPAQMTGAESSTDDYYSSGSSVISQEEIQAQVSLLRSLIQELETVKELFNGNLALAKGTETFLSAAVPGVGELMSGAEKLQTNYKQFNSVIEGLGTQLKEMLLGLSKLSEGIDMLVEQYEVLDQGINSYTGGVEKILDGYGQLVDGAKQLVGGSGKLKDGTNTLYNGTVDMAQGMSDFYDGAGELKDGTGEMRDRTSGMNSEINEQIDNLVSDITGDPSDIGSFVSDENTNVKAVQFVIQTEPIQEPDAPEEEPAAQPKLTFWQKFLKLFGLYNEK